MIHPDVPEWVELVVFVAVATGAYAWLRMLHRACRSFHRSFNTQMKRRMDRLFVFIDPNRLFVVQLLMILLLAALVWVFTGHLGAVILAAAVAGWLPAVLMRRLELRRQQRIERQLPDTLMQLAATLRAGMGMPAAIDHVAQRTPAPLGDELQLLSRERRLGVGFEDSLVSLRERLPLETVQLFVCLLTISQQSGGGLARSLTVLASSCRRHLLLRSKLWALTAQGRLQAHIMSAVPVLVAAVLFVMEPDAMRQLWTTTVGQAVAVTLMVMLGAGFWLVQRVSKGLE